MRSHSVQGHTEKVWDGFVRFFHWTLVVSFAASYWTSQSGMQNTHIVLGYLISVLVVARIVWGFTGTPYARFSNFVYSPGAVLGYLKAIATGHPQHYLGHNPAGGAMVVMLLVGLVVATVAGFIVLMVIEFEAPLPGLMIHMTDAQAYLWREVHETTIDVMLVMIAFHLLGVLLASIQHRENLVRAMITGIKQKPK
ncbi:MAG: cytochrome B561 [Gammaproteobacteria bacterium]|nr:MAG: cytochrome B561 [Gammaproteobacteria bacterium]TND02479.1 MAG: cytochrome B561 [Gammaproteobacteria bacterium]